MGSSRGFSMGVIRMGRMGMPGMAGYRTRHHHSRRLLIDMRRVSVRNMDLEVSECMWKRRRSVLYAVCWPRIDVGGGFNGFVSTSCGLGGNADDPLSVEDYLNIIPTFSI